MTKSKRAQKALATRQAYMKERRRIQSFMRKAEKRGYVWNEYVIPEKIPEKINMNMVNAMRKLTPEKLYRKARYIIDLETGETTSGIRGRDIERSKAGKKAARTRKENKEAEARFFAPELVPDKTDTIKLPDVSVPSQDKSTKKKKEGEDYISFPPADGGLTTFYEIVEPYIRALGEPVGVIYTNAKGKVRRRSQNLWTVAQQSRETVLDMLNRLVEKIGKSKVGYLFKRFEDSLTIYLDTILYDSNAGRVAAATIEVIKILKIGLEEEFTEQERKNISDDEYYSEDFDLPE